MERERERGERERERERERDTFKNIILQGTFLVRKLTEISLKN